MAQNLDQTQTDRSINDSNLSFLKKVQAEAGLPDIYDARDLTIIVYRTMRDLMDNKTASGVESELKVPAEQTKNKRLNLEVAELWRDTNPFVAWISNLRPSLQFDDKTFIYRISQEGSLPANVSAEQVIKAVFFATKAELSSEKIAEIANCLPGQIKTFWENA